MSRKFTVLKSEDVVLRPSWGQNVNLLEGIWISYINISIFQSTLFSSYPPAPYLVCVFSHSVMSSSLWPCRLQHARIPCPSLSSGVCSNSCPLSWWCCLIFLDSLRLCQIKPWGFRVNSFLKLSLKTIHVCSFKNQVFIYYRQCRTHLWTQERKMSIEISKILDLALFLLLLQHLFLEDSLFFWSHRALWETDKDMVL